MKMENKLFIHSFKEEVYNPFQVHLSMYAPFSKENDIINIFIERVVIIYSKHYEFERIISERHVSLNAIG